MQKALKLSLILVVIALGIYALNSVVNGADERSPTEIKERAQKAWDEAYLKGNLDTLDELYEPEFVRHRLYQPDTTGRLDGVKESVKNNRLKFSECRVIIDEVIVSGDWNIVQWTFQGTYAGDRNSKWIFQNKETGKSETIGVSMSAGAKYTQKGCAIIRTVNGKIVEEWGYSNAIVPALIAAGIELKVEPVE